MPPKSLMPAAEGSFGATPTGAAGAAAGGGAGALVACAGLAFLSLNEFWCWGVMGVAGAGVCAAASVSIGAAPVVVFFFLGGCNNWSAMLGVEPLNGR